MHDLFPSDSDIIEKLTHDLDYDAMILKIHKYLFKSHTSVSNISGSTLAYT